MVLEVPIENMIALFVFIVSSAISVIPFPNSFTPRSYPDSIMYVESDLMDSISKCKESDKLVFHIGPDCFTGTSIATTSEGYRIDINPQKIEVSAASEAGVFYAVQTLKQMISDNTIACGTIIDEPAYPYRGLLFDVSRHFRSVDFIKKQLDVMALLKLNRLHFHICDSVGWRLELDSHPELVSTSSFRKELGYYKPSTFVGVPEGYAPGTVWNKPGCYGGYYSKAQIRELVKYADSLHIVIIPEIELPGHSGELHVSHSELFCHHSSSTEESVCPGNELTYLFYQEVLDEVIELFPSEYIHIGGDEASKSSWRDCPACQKRMKDEKLSDVNELQSYMIGRITEYLASKGRKAIGWDEIMEGGNRNDTAVMCWHENEKGIEAADAGHEVVMCPYEYFYLDKYQNAFNHEPYAVTGYNTLENVFSYKMPVSANIIGVQGNLWSEYIILDEQYEYMLYPRAFAVAEIGWTHDAKRTDFTDFRDRVLKFSEVLKGNGYSSFNLNDETQIDEILLGSRLEHKALYAHYSTSGLDPNNKDGQYCTRLTDGKQRTFLNFEGDGMIDIILQESIDARSICGVFFQSLGYEKAGIICPTGKTTVMMPSEVKVWTSSDGKKYTLAGIRRPICDDSNATWLISHVPVYGDFRNVRYIRIEITPSRRCSNFAISEVIVE